MPTRERSVRYEAYTKISPAGSTLPTCLSGETETGRNTDLHSGSTIKSMRNDNILIGCLNACSIRNKTAVLTNMLVDENLDLLAITESFHESADDVALKRITPDGYSALEKARGTSEGSGKSVSPRGGVVLIHRNTLLAKSVVFDFKAVHFEYLTVMITAQGVKTLIAVVYRPGSKPATAAFISEFSKFLELLAVYNCNVAILGDLNLHLDQPLNNMTSSFNTVLECFGLCQLIRGPTHVAGHTLDVVITRSTQADGFCWKVHPATISDHSLITTSFPLRRPLPVPFYSSTRAWRGFDKEAFRLQLSNSLLCRDASEWSDLSPDDMADRYRDTLVDLLDRLAPRCEVVSHYRPTTPWFNSACRAMKRMARCFERRYRRSGLDGDRNDWIAQLRSNQEFYRNTQDAFWQTTVENSSGNARKLWNSISAIMGSKKHSPAVDGLNAGIFLKTFEDKVKDVRASTEGSVPAEYSNFIGDYLTRFSEVSLEDVEMLIRKSSNKSCGLDPAPTWLIRDFAVELAPFICALFNKSLSLGSVPRSFKIADITPVLKKSSLDASVPSNYRPILQSVLSIQASREDSQQPACRAPTGQ